MIFVAGARDIGADIRLFHVFDFAFFLVVSMDPYFSFSFLVHHEVMSLETPAVSSRRTLHCVAHTHAHRTQTHGALASNWCGLSKWT